MTEYTVIDYLNIINFEVCDGARFQWKCFGENAYCYSYNVFSERFYDFDFDIVFDTVTKQIYQASVFWRTKDDLSLTWVDETYKERYLTEMSNYVPINNETYVTDISEIFNIVKEYFS